MKSLLLSLIAFTLVPSAQSSSGGASASVQVTSAASGGILLYDNGRTDPLTDGGNEMTAWVQADDFELTLNSTVVSASIDWLDQNVGNGWDGGVEWFVFTDANGMPGPVLAQGIGIPTSTTLIASFGMDDWYETCFDLDVPLSLSASTRYWFGVHFAADQDYFRDDIFLAYSSQQAFNFSQQSMGGTFNNWFQSIAEDRAFRLFGTLCNDSASATLRNDSTGSNPLGYSATLPIIGLTWSATVDNGLAGNNLAGIVGFLTPIEVFVPAAGEFLLVNVFDPAGELLGLTFVSTAGVASFNKAIPPDPNLCGTAISTQGFGIGGVNTITLHNAYDLVLGT